MEDIQDNTATGLHVLCDKTVFSGEAVDIIAVHGLNGHRVLSWTLDDPEGIRAMWLRDLLPGQIPEGRIMTFGYSCKDSDGRRFLSTPGINYVARNLVEALTNARLESEYDNRPIVFLAHDLGGTVVKQALLLANNDETYFSILRNTRRVVFFGTPHRANDLSSWEDLIFNIVLASSPRCVSQGLPNIMREFAKTLADQAMDFSSIVAEFLLVNIYQSELTLPDAETVVSRYSATTDMLCEKNLSRRRLHRDLCRFARTDDEFGLIWRAMKLDHNKEYIECLRALATLGPTPFPVPVAVSRPFEGICDQMQYKQWLESPKSSMIHLYGQQGLGKSVLSRYLFQSLRTRDPAGAIITYYSFNDQDERRNSSLTLLSSLAYQMLTHDPSLFPHVRDIYRLMKEQSSWTPNALWIFFQSLLSTRQLEGLVCVLNNIHDCDQSRTALLGRLAALQLNESLRVNVKFLFVSEPHSDIRNSLKLCPSINLDGNEVIKKYIKIFIEHRVAGLIERVPVFRKSNEIESKLGDCRNFLHLSLALSYLENGRFLSTPRAIRKELEGLPGRIPNLVFTTLQALPEWGQKAIGWILHARRPMSVNELAVATALEVDHNKVRLAEEDIPRDVTTDLREVFGSLVKVENNNVFFVHREIKESFLREINSNQGATLKQAISSHWDITVLLLRYLSMEEFADAAMMGFLRDEQKRRPPGLYFDLMSYAVQYWPAHYRKAQDQGCHAEEILKFLREPNLMKVWSELDWRLGSINTQPNLCVTSPLLFASQLGFSDVVKTLLATGSGDASIAADRNFAIELASWGGHLDAVEQLLDDGIEDSASIMRGLQSASAKGYEEIVGVLHRHLSKFITKPIYEPTLICQAAENGHETLVEHFVEAGSDVDSAYEGETPLQLAAKNGHESIARFLLKYGADANSARGNAVKPVLLAASKGHTAVVQALLEWKPDINISDQDGSTALHLAAQNGYLDIAKLLLDAGANAKVININGSTPLHLASQSKDEEVAMLLIKDNTDFDQQDLDGDTPLKLASVRGHEKLVEVLLEKGARVNLRDNQDHTALYSAILHDHEAIANRLLSSGADPTLEDDQPDSRPLIEAAKRGFISVCGMSVQKGAAVNLKDKNGWNALHHAAAMGYEEIVRLLVQNNANINLEEDDNRKTPLTLAATAGHTKTVEFLISSGADYNVKDSNKRTILSQVAGFRRDTAVAGAHDSTIRALLNAGIDCEALDESRKTALHLAARAGNLGIVRVLLDSDVSTELQDRIKWTPLHYAARSGHKEVVQTLLQHGADGEAEDDDAWTPLHIAAMWGRVTVMEVLWENHADLNRKTTEGRAPLHFTYDKKAAAEWLLKHDVDMNVRANDLTTPLMLAAKDGEAGILELFLQYGADPHLCDKDGKSALHYASKRSNLTAAVLLLDAGVDINIQDNEKQSSLHIAVKNENMDLTIELLKRKAQIDLQDKEGNTPLFHAVAQRHKGLIRTLIDYHANMEARNTEGLTPWLVAMEARIESDEDDTWELLMELGADINASGGREHGTAIHEAALNGEIKLVHQLLAHGANVNAPGGRFPNALNAAIWSGTFDLLPALLDARADVNGQDDQGLSALHLAARYDNWSIIETLVAAGGDPDIKDKQGRTMLHHAASRQKYSVVSRILQDEKGCDVEVADDDGWTPLHWASRSDNGAVVELLVRKGANPLKQSRNGWTAENIAIFHHQEDLLRLFVLEDAQQNSRVESLLDSGLGEMKLEEKEEKKEKEEKEEKKEKRKWARGSRQWSCYCDGCHQMPMYGIRWRCRNCDDFDFCFKCYWSREKTHDPSHTFEKIGSGPEESPELENDGEPDGEKDESSDSD